MMNKQVSRVLVAASGAILLSLPIAAGAQTANYPGTTPPQVLGETVTRNAPVEVPAQVLGESVTKGSDSLPVTGGDVAGLAGLGLGAIAVGSVLVRRSRSRSA